MENTDQLNPQERKDPPHNFLVRIANAQTKIEDILKTTELKKLTEAGKQLLDWMTSIQTADLHEVLSDGAPISDSADRALNEFLKLLDVSVTKVERVVSGFHITGWSGGKKIRTYHKNLEDAWKRVIPHLATVNEPAVPSESLTLPDNTAKGGNPEPLEIHSRDPPAWTKLLGPCRTILKSVSAATPLIPVVGQFVQCGVDVGNAIIDMLDGMSQNVQAIQDLCRRIARLCSMITIFQDTRKGFYGSGEAIQHLESFRRLCDLIREDVDRLKTQHPVGKFVFSSDNAAAIGDLNRKIDEALKELDIYLALNANRMLEDLGQARLISLLGPDNWGNIGYTDEDGTCLPGTREKLLQQLDVWADDPASEPLRLVRGQAGRGKSTIAKTLAKRFRARHGKTTSCAVFHFRRTNEELNGRPIRALALQLVRNGDSRLRNAILQTVHEHEGMAGSHLEDQLRVLLVTPLEKLKSDPPRVLLVIDGLDECGDPKFSASLLRLVLQYLPSLPSSIKLFITTRPEHHIVLAYRGLKESDELYDLDSVDATDMDLDLHTFFKQRLAEIKQDHELPDEWPSDGAIVQLVDLSQGLFQWANTAIEFLNWAPESRLQMLLHPTSNLVGLPALYRQILEDAFPCTPKRTNVLLQYVLTSLVAAPNSISLTSLAYLWDPPLDDPHPRQSNKSPEIQAEILDHLRSFIMVPADPDEPLRILHTSVRDFLVNKDDCPDPRFFVDNAQHCHERLATSCLERMLRDLKSFDVENFCGPTQTSTEARDAFRASISAGLVFSARSWSTHLSQVGHDEAHTACQLLHSLLDDFCQTNLIHWIEILSLAGAVDEINSITQQGKDWVGLDERYSQTYDLLDDVQRLCNDSFDPIVTSAYHISRSVLLHRAHDTPLRGIYSIGDHAPIIIRGPFHPRVVCYCMAISPDGKMFAFGFNDGVIRLGNLDTGKPIGKPLTGHAEGVCSVAFCPRGKMIVSGSNDKTIRLWNPETGAPIGEPLWGHSDEVNSVAFSPNGKMIASGSSDNTIRLWNPDTGMSIGQPMEGHSGRIWRITFSPNGKLIASGAWDNTVRLWDVETRISVGEPLIGHSGSVLCVTFAPDGRMIASGSMDGTIRFWNPETGTPLGEPVGGPLGPVNELTFSPDGKMIASASGNSIRLWIPENGEPIGEPFERHSYVIISAAFSPDGRRIVSGGEDNTIRLWDPESGTPIGRAASHHTAFIKSVTFSPDGKISASCSSDGNIRLWNLDTGKPIGELLRGHSGWVTGVTLSSDGRIFASSSSDGVIRTWNPENGNPLGEPLGGNQGAIQFVGLSSEGKIIASRSQDGTIQLWDVENWMQIGKVRSDENYVPITPASEAIGALGNSGAGGRQQIIRYGQESGKEKYGWVFRDNRRWFWLPDTWRPSSGGQDLTASLFNTTLVIPHRDIPILDVSEIL